MIEGAKKLNDQKKFRMIRLAYGFSLVLVLIFFLLMLSEERNIPAAILFVMALTLLILARKVFFSPTIYFSKEFLFISIINEQKSIPLNSVSSFTRESLFVGDFLDYPYPKRKFRIHYSNSQGNKSKVSFSIVLDKEGIDNLRELLGFIKFRNPNFKGQV